MSNEMRDEMLLGQWHYKYEIKNYFSKIIVGQGVNTNDWDLSDFARAWAEYDIEGFTVWFENEWSGYFRAGFVQAHKDFKAAVLDYNIKQDEKYYGYLRV